MTQEPAPRFLTARWLRLVMLNYIVDPDVLISRVPSDTNLDMWNDQCFVSVVGFQFVDTRVLGVPIPFHRNFPEVNLRFYVRHRANGETRRGVVFVKEIVPRRALAWIANSLYGENYVALPMSSTDTGDHVSYSWEHFGQGCSLGVAISGEPYLPAQDSEESFITEHYWGYAAQRDGSTVEYQVEHPQWRVWRGVQPTFECDVSSLYGAEFAPFLSRPPSSCFLAEGSNVIVRKGIPVERSA